MLIPRQVFHIRHIIDQVSDLLIGAYQNEATKKGMVNIMVNNSAGDILRQSVKSSENYCRVANRYSNMPWQLICSDNIF